MRLQMHINTHVDGEGGGEGANEEQTLIEQQSMIRNDYLQVLRVCLNIFAMYMSDLRLIKAFYNEENVKHLEDLLDVSALISGVCDLIKIGIDNLTFLGDNSLEQAALSRRLITLQLNSSDRAAQLFNALLQRLVKCTKTCSTLFWLDAADINKATAITPEGNNLRPIDVLNITALQWTLNYELLKTSQFFYNEFAKIYSIVLEDEEDDVEEEKSKEKEKQLADKTKTERTPKQSKDPLARGDKTILDILKLNYNALSCLLIPPRIKQTTTTNSTENKTLVASNAQNLEQQQSQLERQKHIYTFTNALSDDDNSHNTFDCLSSSLEDLLSSTDLRTDQLQQGVNGYSIVPTTTTTTTAAINLAHIDQSENCAYDKITEFYDENFRETFLQKLYPNQQQQQQQQHSFDTLLMQESIVLFDIRHQVETQEPHSLALTNANTISSSWSLLSSTSSNNCGPTETLSTILADPKTQEGVPQTKESLIAKLFGMFGSFFSGSLSNSASSRDLQQSEETPIDEDLLCFYTAHGDGKKLLLKLFEATMAISVKGYQNEEVEKMQKHLRKLKTVILSSATANWTQHSEENARENIILQTLQTLLKIAELASASNALNATNNADLATGGDGDGNVERADDGYAHTAGNGTGDDEENANADCSTAALNSHLPPPRARHYTSTNSAHTRHLLSVGQSSNSCRPLSGDSGDTNEYHSTRASYVCPDSEFELSDNEDFYMTGEDGYEADAEVPEVSDSEADVVTAEIWHSLQPTSRYRTHVLHNGLCRLVVEILIELSQMCTRDPTGWSEHLAQLANRLYVIREYLGGPVLLLRGFAPVLTCSDVRLKELQQAILELIVDLNTPDALCAFFSILATKQPPMELLMQYMSYICAGSLKKVQPSVELEFPLLLDGKCVSTADAAFTDHIQQIHNNHLNCNALTPFTRAPCVIPITHARLWSNEGVTLSLWLQVKGSQRHKSLTQINEEDTRSASEDYLKSHIVSLGTNQAMLSIYINSNLQLVFETCKPNADLQTRQPTAETNNETGKTNTTTKTTSRNSNNNSNAVVATAVSPSSLRGVLKHTKLVLMSFSNMNLFHSNSISSSYFEGTYMELKTTRLTRNKWTHLMCAIEMHNDSLDLLVSINGLDQHRLSLPFRNLRNLVRTHTFQLVSLGDGVTSKTPATSLGNNTESRSTFDGFPLRLGISNLMLFNRKIVDRETILNLTAMGPDFAELQQCKVGNWKPNYGFLNLNKMPSPRFGHFGAAMKTLRQAHILTFSAQQTDVVMGTKIGTETYTGVPYGLILYGELLQNQLQSLQTATILSGGLSALLYLFARIVEGSSDASTQALALDLFLNITFSDSQLYAEFLRNDYINLIGYVIRTERCTKDVRLLQSIVNNACNQPVIHKRCDGLHVNEHTTAALVYPRLITSMLRRYSDWHRSGAEQSDVLDMLLQCILALTRDKHPQRDFNMEQLNNAGFMREILNLCKVYIIASPNPIYMSPCAARSYVQILSVFAGSPPSTSLMDEIMKLLLLLQKPSECYITHDRAHFYFLLTTQLPVKEKPITSLSRVAAASFRRSERTVNPSSVPSATSVSPTLPDNRAARIGFLRKFHATRSPYRRVLHEFEENLDSVADCSKLNKQALRLLSPVEVYKWRTKIKRHISISAPTTPIHLSSSITPKSARLMHTPIKSATRKRLRIHSSSSVRSLSHSAGEEKRLRRIDRGDTSLSDAVAAAIGDYGENSPFSDVFNISTTSTGSRKASKSITKADVYATPGIIALQEGLYTLLKDFLCLLPDNALEEVLKHYIKIEFLLVVANHNSCAVRAAIIHLLAALTKRLAASELQAAIKSYYPQHLANQLSIHVTDERMFEACLEWVSGVHGQLDMLQKECTLHIPNRFGVNALIAIASKATLQPTEEFAVQCFKSLYNVYLSVDLEESLALNEAGLLQGCVKALFNHCKKSPHMLQTDSVLAILNLLTTVGEKSLKSVGHINIVWDILNMLSFYQEKQATAIIQAFRSWQAQLHLNWLNMFIGQKKMSWNFKVHTLSESSLTLSETKTRLDLLIDRSTQFFTVFDNEYNPSEYEIKLFELLISYSIATNQRCNNFIAWGLLPSRPLELRAFIVDALWMSCQDEFVPSITCDGKVIKSLLWMCMLEDFETPIANLEPLCLRLGINDKDSASSLNAVLDRVEISLRTTSVKQKSLLEKTIYKHETLAANCIESSMILTRRATELQNAERKTIMVQMKEYDETYTYVKWMEIIRRMAHEGAPWYNKDRAENYWELDDTEGPSRVHTRLRRCHLDIDKRFFMEDYDQPTSAKSRANAVYTRPLDYLISSYNQQLNITRNAQILHNFSAKYLPVDGEIDGELIITDHKLYFLATFRCKYFYVSCDISGISEIWLKRYKHLENAFEIFLDTSQSLFFSLQNQSDCKVMRDVFCDKIVTPPDNSKLLHITQQWREGLLTNWEYLMTLNQISGRTYNDLMQYPVFPWVLANYTGELLDLTAVENFRKLEKPVAVQHPENEQHYINNYTYMSNTMTNMGSLVLPPYHYSSHYSNSGTVLHFLVRVPPFTGYFLRYQDNNFDLPDRTFHALGTTWCLASRDSSTDIKELIPEFFCLPEMFENFERFNFGCRQSGERVHDVLLPPWCLHDPRLFVLVHRQALESELVRNNLHNWIDLIFGYKQTGENAVEAVNVFHPATYPVFLESEINDPIERKAVETMVNTYGQMPRQLFKTPHPASRALNYCLGDKELLPYVRGLRWGVYLGSPQLPAPILGNIYKLPDSNRLIAFSNTNVVYTLPAKAAVMQGAELDTYNVIYWGCPDRIVRMQPLNKTQAPSKQLLHDSAFDDITVCGAGPQCNQLWFGHKSGRISVYRCNSVEGDGRMAAKSRQSYVRGLQLSYNSAFRKIATKVSGGAGNVGGAGSSSGIGSGMKLDEDDVEDYISTTNVSTSASTSAAGFESQQRESGAELIWNGPIVLVRHTDAITCIELSLEFKIAVTAGRDGIAVIWDLNDLSYIRTIERPAEIHHSPITLIAISPTLGDIVSVHTITQTQSSEVAATSTATKSAMSTTQLPDECFEVTEENLDDFVNVSINPNGKSILRLHSVNGRYVQHIVHEDRISAVCYSYIKEGVGVNVIATAVEGGTVRLWSSWNLSFVREIITGLSDIKSITYSTHQHLVVLTQESWIQVWETDGLYGSAPKFPQIAYK